MTKKIPLTSNYSFSELAAAIRGREPFNKRAKLTDAEIMEMLKISEQFLADKMLKLTKKSEGGLLEEGGEKDPVSGNEVPAGSTKKEVRDDIPAQLSEGEFVFPADVVRYLGLDFLMKLRQKAKAGLKRMEEMGQMGNSEEATLPDDIPFTLDDLDVEEDGRLNFSEGGVADEEAGVFGKPKDTEDDKDDEASFDDLIGGGSFGKYDELRKFVGPNGEIRYIPFKDGEPLPPYKDILEGLTEKGYTYTPPSEEDDKKPPEEQMPVEEVKEEKDREKEQQTAKEDKERSERSLDNAVQQAIEAGMKSEKDIIDWIKGGNVKVGKFKVPGFLYNNIPLPGQEFGPITNAINRNPNVQQGFDIKEPLPEPKPTISTQTDAMMSPEGTRRLDKQAETRKIIEDRKRAKDTQNKIDQIEKDKKEQIDKLDQQIAEYMEELEESGLTISEQDTTIKGLEEQKQKIIEESNNKVKGLNTQIANLTGSVKDKETVIESYKTSETALKEQISNLKGEKERLQQAVNTKDAQLAKSQQQIQEQNNRLSQLSSKTGSAAPNVIKDDSGTTFKGGKLTTDSSGKIVKVNDRPVIVKDNRDRDRDRDRPSGGGTPFSRPEPKPETKKESFEKKISRRGGFNIGGLASKKPKKKKVMKRGGLASKK
jgi:hypothetical protein